LKLHYIGMRNLQIWGISDCNHYYTVGHSACLRAAQSHRSHSHCRYRVYRAIWHVK
jgi:hypothetical protein